jgi:hypothetical protein
MAVMLPGDAETVDQLREIIRQGNVTEFRVIVVNVLDNGTRVPDERITTAADRVAYDLIPVDTTEQFPPEVLNAVVPYNRPIRGNARLVSAAVGDPMRLMRYGAGHPTPHQYRLLQDTERAGYVRCNGTPLE